MEGLIGDSILIGLGFVFGVLQSDQIVEGFGLFMLDIAWLYARVVG